VSHYHDEHTEHTVYGELVCHLPYAIFSVAIGMVLLSLISYAASCSGVPIEHSAQRADVLFHSFHFVHIIFAATGTIITFLRFSKNLLGALAVGIVSPMVFCSLSDVVFPYMAGRLLGVHMHFHLCFIDELHNVLPFLFVGILNGFVMSWHHNNRQSLYSIFSHVGHILVSSFASSFYLFTHGLTNWSANMGVIFMLLIVVVILPCTLSDLVVPMTFARLSGGKK